VKIAVSGKSELEARVETYRKNMAGAVEEDDHEVRESVR
jgi:hypothetical protein